MWLMLIAADVAADPNVVVVAWADEAYTHRKYEGGKPRVERYVFLQGRRFDGTTRDDSLTDITFLKIAETLAYQIASENYLPTKDVKAADLLLVVHWGVTEPHVSMDDLRGTTNTGVDQQSVEQAAAMSQIRAPEDPNTPDDPANAFFVDSTEPFRAYAFDEAERVSDPVGLHCAASADVKGPGDDGEGRNAPDGPALGAVLHHRSRL